MSTPESLWTSPPARPVLSPLAVHVWRVPLDLPPHQLARLRTTLTDDEIQRADRFHFQRDRDRFIVARGALRDILGRYVGETPLQLRFDYSSYGKPALRRAPHQPTVAFNLSHSGVLALCAVTLPREIGVDIEQIRPDIECEQIAERFFSPAERAVLRRIPHQQQPDAFFACWTRKEAYIKARGDGLSRPLDEFDVSLAPNEPARLLATRDDPRQAERWSLYALEPGLGYKAALVVEGRVEQIDCWQWSGSL